jgi:hypothetical protein
MVIGGLAALLLAGSALAHPGGVVDMVDVLARALGVTAEEVEQAKADGTLRGLLADVPRAGLQAAYEAKATEVIDDAADAGDITSAQAERLRDRVTADRGDLSDAEIETLRGLRGVADVDPVAVFASLLGITYEEVKAARVDGILRDRLAEVDRVALAAAFTDARDAVIAAGEEAGDLTAEQAALLRDAGWGSRGPHSWGRGDQGRWGGGRWHKGGCSA